MELSRPQSAIRAICLVGGSRLTVESRLGTAATPQPTAVVERLGPKAVRVTLDATALALRDGAVYKARTVIVRSNDPQPAPSPEVNARWRAWRLVGCTATGPTRIFRAAGPVDHRVGLSFDDDPSGYTSAILRLLAQYHAHATFFVIGDQVRWRADMIRRELREGHMVGNHSLHHEMPANPSGIAATQQIIRGATGFTPCSFRPPGGMYNGGMGAAVQDMGMRTIIWSVDTRD